MGRAEVGTPSPSQDAWRTELAKVKGIDLDAQYSLERTGGDLFDMVRVGRRIAFLLTDIAGRRPDVDPILAEMRRVFRMSAAALFSATDVNLMEAMEALIHEINQALVDAAKGVRFAPTMVGCYDEQLGVMAYINAGGQAAIIRDSEGTRPLPNVSMPLGLFTHLPYDASIQAFEPGAMLLVVTKGITESMEGKKPFGLEGSIQVVRNSKYESANELCGAVLKAAQRVERRRWLWSPFKSKLPREDMTALAMIRTI